MAVDVKEIVDSIMKKAQSDPDFMNKLKKDPEKAIESVTGIDIPDGMANQVLTAVKGQLTVDKISGVMKMFK